MCKRRWQTSKRGSQQVCVTWALVLSTSSVPVSNGRSGSDKSRARLLILQDLLQSCSRVGRGIVEDMCYKPRLVWTGLTITH